MTRIHTGFTLIEVLVVVVVVSILMSVVVSSFTGVDAEQELRGYAERLALRIELARDKAVQTNREWGVYVDEEGVRFAEYDEINVEWVQRADRPFTQESYSADLTFEAKVEDAVTLTAENDDDLPPTIVLFSSGETTPFELSIEHKDWQSQPWLLASDGFTRTELTRPEVY